MASSGPGDELEYSFLSHYVDIDRDYWIKQCALSLHIPNMTDWCPPHLQDISQLTNYYNQLVLEAAFANQLDFPNAIYLDAVDQDGTIRVGTQLFPDSTDQDTLTAKYAYVSNFLLYNLRKVCGSSTSSQCVSLKTLLLANRAQYPLQIWNDPTHGRLVNWPSP